MNVGKRVYQTLRNLAYKFYELLHETASS